MDEYIGVLTLDLDCRKTLPKISAGQFDKGRKYLVYITKNGSPFSAQNSTVILQGKRHDKSNFSIACNVETDGSVTFELNDEILSASGTAFAKLILSDSTRNYSTQIFAIDVDACFEGNIDDEENYSVLNDLINRLMLLFELDDPNVTEFASCKEKVEEYLSLPDYSPDDYSTSHIPNPTGIDNNHYDRPNGIDIDLPSGSTKIILRDAVTGKEQEEAVSGTGYKIENLIPGHLYSYNIINNASLSLKIGTCRSTGHVRMINGGGDTYNIRDIGGWTCDGGRLKYGLIYRGSELNVHVSTLTSAQIALFKDLLEIRDEIDLRSDKGAAGITDTALGVGVGYIRVPLPYYTNIFLNSTEGNGPELTVQIMRRIIGNLRSGKVSYLHCEAGADRTGTIAMLIETVCGVSQSDLDRDYEMTTFSFKPNGEYNTRRRSDGSDATANWKTLIARIMNLEGDSFQDKVIRFLLRWGISIDELNALRDCLIDGEPEKLVNPYGNITVTKNLTNIRAGNDTDTIEMYQPFETELIADNACEITALSVMMGGTDASKYLIHGKVRIPHVTGNIVITGSAQKISPCKAALEINEETVPESVNWDDRIPFSFDGNGYKLAMYNGELWGLYNVNKDPRTGVINYDWIRIASESDIDDLNVNIDDLNANKVDKTRKIAGIDLKDDITAQELTDALEIEGTKGEKGDKGDPGADGYSPTATVTKSGTQTTVTITDKNGTTTAVVNDGPKGDTGATGPQGPKGDTGATGSQGPKGDTGATGPQGPKGDKGDTPTAAEIREAIDLTDYATKEYVNDLIGGIENGSY